MMSKRHICPPRSEAYIRSARPSPLTSTTRTSLGIARVIAGSCLSAPPSAPARHSVTPVIRSSIRILAPLPSGLVGWIRVSWTESYPPPITTTALSAFCPPVLMSIRATTGVDQLCETSGSLTVHRSSGEFLSVTFSAKYVPPPRRMPKIRITKSPPSMMPFLFASLTIGTMLPSMPYCLYLALGSKNSRVMLLSSCFGTNDHSSVPVAPSIACR